MIILERNPKLLLVRQPEHARMSGRIAFRWRRPGWLPPGAWRRFREAVRRHDDGWTLEEARPALDPRGCPHDFLSLPRERHQAVWRRSIALANHADPFGGLLVAEHARWLTGMSRRRASAAERLKIGRFLEEIGQEIVRARRTLEAGTPEDRLVAEPPNLLRERRLFSFFDSLSLRLLGAIGLEASEPVAFGGREETLRLKGDGGKLTIEPWPFRGARFRLEVQALQVVEGPFGGTKAFAAALARARRKTLRWELSG